MPVPLIKLSLLALPLLMLGCVTSQRIPADVDVSLLPKASPDATDILYLQSNVNCQFFVDGKPIVSGKRVRILVTKKDHQLVCKPDDYRAKEDYVQPPYDPSHPIGFTFLLEDKLQIADRLVTEGEATTEPLKLPSGSCSIQSSDSLAVLPFSVNAKGQEAQRLGNVLAESMTVRLINSRATRVIERAQIDQLVKEADRETFMSQTGLMDQKTIQSVGNLIGAKYLVVGNVVVIENALQVTGRVIHVKTGEILIASQVAGPKENVFALGEKLATNVANQIKSCTGGPSPVSQ
jgi:TolB-like protein